MAWKSEETLGGPLIRKPFFPFVPGRNSDSYSAPNVNRSSEPEGYVTRKTVPVASPGRNSDSYSGPNFNRSSEPEGYVTRKTVPVASPGRNSDNYSAPNVNRSSEPEGYVTRKTVPVASPYGYGDEYKHSSPSPNQAYPSRNDEGWRQQTSPVHGRPQKVDDFLNNIQIQASQPAKFDPATNWRDSQQSPPYNGDNGYKDSGNFSSKPTGNIIRNDKYDGYNGARGYDDSGVYGTQGNDYGRDHRNKPTEKFNLAPQPWEANYRENIDKTDAPRRSGKLRPIINSREAEKKYKGTPIINSREAEKKYNGTSI